MNRIKKYRLIVRLRPEGPWVDVTNISNDESVALIRLEICQKIYMTGFFGQKSYTLKVRKLRRFLLKKKQRKCINVSYFSRFLVKI